MEFWPTTVETYPTSLDLLCKVSKEFAAESDLGTVLNRVLSLSIEHVGAISGSIVVLDDQKQPMETAFLMPGFQPDNRLLQLHVTFEYGLAGWVARTEKPVLMNDTSRDERWLQRPDDSAEGTGSKSAISVPIIAREQLVGIMTLVHSLSGFFTEDHLQLVQTIADQAGMAIVNARLNEEHQRQMRTENVWAEYAVAISMSLDLDDVFQRLFNGISQALNPEQAWICQVYPLENELEYRAVSSHSQKNLLGKRIPIGSGILGWVVRNERGVIVPDIWLDKRFQPDIDMDVVGDQPSRAFICAPIRSEGHIVGVIAASASPSVSFNPTHLKILEGIGAMTGAAIRQVHFYQESQVAQKRYLELFEHNVDPILLSDHFGKITNVNRRACSMIKASEKQLINSHVADLFNMKQASDFHLPEISITKPGIFDAILRTHLGREIPVEVYLREIPDGSMQLHWTFRELSERKDLDQVKEDLIEMVYHDLRSPLSNVISSLETLDAMRFADQTIDSLLKIALRSTEHVQRLTNSLLDINRLEAGQKIGNQSQVNPADLLEYGVGAIHLLTIDKQILIHVKIRENLGYLWVDEDMIRRVIINLLENAVKFTSSKGKIWVGAKRMRKMILFWVKDFGPGISPSKREQIFEKFVRLQTQEKSRGLGLGLAYCRLAVQAHGGEIWVESQPGEGACFKFTLPITSK